MSKLLYWISIQGVKERYPVNGSELSLLFQIVDEYLQTTLPTNTSITPVPLIAMNETVNATGESTTESGGLYPPELFNMEQKRSGAGTPGVKITFKLGKLEIDAHGLTHCDRRSSGLSTIFVNRFLI